VKNHKIEIIKTMKNNWQTKKINEVCSVGAGNSAPQKREFFKDGKYPFFRTSDAGAIHIGKISDSNDYLNDIGVKGLKLFKKGTILLPKSGASTFLNHRVIMVVDGYVSSHLATIKVDGKILDNHFIFYFLQEIRAQDLIQDHKYPSLNLPVIGNIEIPVPPLTEQRRIVKILDEFFEKTAKVKEITEKNLQNSKKLFESYLQSIFANPGKDWKKQNIGEFLKLEYGKPLDIKDRCLSGKFPVYGANGEKDRTNKFYYNKSTVIIGRKGSAGELNLTENKFWPLDVTYFVTFDDEKYDLKFVYFLLLTLKLTRLAKGVKPGVNRNDVYSINVFMPSLKEQKSIVTKLSALSTETKKLETIYKQKLADLEELKKSVLKKAFSGEL
jgi:type I restriction enzyme S subunit